MSGVNKFSEVGQVKIQHVVVAEEKSSTIAKEKLVPSEKVTPSQGDEKGKIFLNDMEEPVQTIRRNYLDNFQGQSTGSTGWFNLDNKWLKIKFLHLNRSSIKNFLKRISKVNISKHIKPL